jgi:hypothetical protein
MRHWIRAEVDWETFSFTFSSAKKNKKNWIHACLFLHKAYSRQLKCDMVWKWRCRFRLTFGESLRWLYTCLGGGQRLINFFGDVQMKPEYALCVYGPPVGDTTGWLQQGSKDRLLEALGQAEPRYVSFFQLPSVVPFLIIPTTFVPTFCKSMK